MQREMAVKEWCLDRAIGVIMSQGKKEPPSEDYIKMAKSFEEYITESP